MNVEHYLGSSQSILQQKKKFYDAVYDFYVEYAMCVWSYDDDEVGGVFNLVVLNTFLNYI